MAGQWFADADRAAQVAAQTGPPASLHGRVVLQPAGVDRRLPALAALVREPGAVLVAHRPERRAVVRRSDGAYAKVVRPERVADVARTARAAVAPGARVPEVVDVDERAGVVVSAPLPGITLYELLATGSPDAVAAARTVGRALAALHASPLSPHVGVHDGAAEQQVLTRWEELAHAYGVLSAPRGADAGLLDRTGPLVPVHRDLHDKQVLVDADGEVGLLDFDLAAAGEAALDLANLLVHLELRVLQGVCPPELARAASAAVTDGYRPSPQVRARLPVYDASARRRLVAVYAFRPASSAAARRLVVDRRPAA